MPRIFFEVGIRNSEGSNHDGSGPGVERTPNLVCTVFM